MQIDNSLSVSLSASRQPGVAGIGKTSLVVESSAGPLTQSDLDMLHHVYGDFVWPTGSEGKGAPAIAFDIAEERRRLQSLGFQENLKSTAAEVLLLKQYDTEHYDTAKLAQGLAYLKDHGTKIGVAGQNLLDQVAAKNAPHAQHQDPNGTYL